MSGLVVRSATMLPVALMVSALLTGCADVDPYARPGMWQPTGANARNLAAMVANPRDLIRGHGESRNGGWESTPPVTHLWAGRPAALPEASSQSGASGPATPAAPTGAN